MNQRLALLVLVLMPIGGCASVGPSHLGASAELSSEQLGAIRRGMSRHQVGPEALRLGPVQATRTSSEGIQFCGRAYVGGTTALGAPNVRLFAGSFPSESVNGLRLDVPTDPTASQALAEVCRSKGLGV